MNNAAAIIRSLIIYGLCLPLAIYLGYVHYRVLGATLVGMAFVLPSFLMVVAIGAAYSAYGGIAWMQAVFYGVGAAVIGIIAMSAWKLTTKNIGKDKLLWAIFLVSAAVTVISLTSQVCGSIDARPLARPTRSTRPPRRARSTARCTVDGTPAHSYTRSAPRRPACWCPSTRATCWRARRWPRRCAPARSSRPAASGASAASDSAATAAAGFGRSGAPRGRPDPDWRLWRSWRVRVTPSGPFAKPERGAGVVQHLRFALRDVERIGARDGNAAQYSSLRYKTRRTRKTRGAFCA